VPCATWWTEQTVEKAESVEPGLIYQQMLYSSNDARPVRAHVLRVACVGTEFRFDVKGSYGVRIRPSVIAKESKALAVVNGGFFNMEEGWSIGLVMNHRRLLRLPCPAKKFRATVGFLSKGVLFDWIHPADIEDNRIGEAKPDWDKCRAALGAGPMLVRQGVNYLETDTQEFNMTGLAPRTAIGVTEDGTVILLVVDGRQVWWSRGVSLPELADLILAHGAVDALNLDGGGSSVMILQDEIVNRPSDGSQLGLTGKERTVTNVLTVTKIPKKEN
jgi:exopolysaccharide biosynthesis protein